MLIAQYPTAEQIQELLTGPADTPVVMVNLLRFKDRADSPDEGLAGVDAYKLYGEPMRRIVEERGGARRAVADRDHGGVDLSGDAWMRRFAAGRHFIAT